MFTFYVFSYVISGQQPFTFFRCDLRNQQWEIIVIVIIIIIITNN